MMLNKQNVSVFILSAALLFSLVLIPTPASAKRGGEGGRGNGPVVYVTGQGLAYDSIVTADPLPMKGRFQKLEVGGPTGLQTEFGPGDQGFVGGRWWLDLNANNIMDPPGEGGDHYFLCPLLGPGFVP